ncbi:AbiTii domain-containing protein [Hyalangium gracile]|uniref:AbiTii domain-containing protein n=1 Tax=Hyalangium gracile TaxID=394092 RepID=UPI001CC94D00|nr:hypothetical protein [Hyalangium gracile]
MPQTSLVIELQALAQESATDVVELVRRAKVVAVKLQQPEFAAWLEYELNGYPSDDKIPDYRKIPTALVVKNPFHGPQPVVWSDSSWIAEHFSSYMVNSPVGQLASLVARGDGPFELSISPPEMELLLKLNRTFGRLPTARRLDKSAVVGILDAVRNKILNWSLELEAHGVLGDGMTFSNKEKEAASTITIHNYGSFVQGDNASVATAHNSQGANVTSASGRADVRQRLTTAVTQVNLNDAEVANALQKILTAVEASPQLTPERKSEATEQLAFVAEQCVLPAKDRQPPTVLKSVLVGLRDTLGLSADVLQVWGSFGPIICAKLAVLGLF